MSLPQDQATGCVQRHAAAGDETKLGVLHLTQSAFAANLTDAFHDMQPTLHVRFRQISAGGFDWHAGAADANAITPLHVVASFAFAAETGVLKPEQYGDCEIVI